MLIHAGGRELQARCHPRRSITYYAQAFVPLLRTVLKVCVATPEVGRCLGQQLQTFSTSLYSAAVERLCIDLRLITPGVGQLLSTFGL